MSRRLSTLLKDFCHAGFSDAISAGEISAGE